jgi:SpoVK/Ycf46/Vps4 family AAA+-type ATPase
MFYSDKYYYRYDYFVKIPDYLSIYSDSNKNTIEALPSYKYYYRYNNYNVKYALPMYNAPAEKPPSPISKHPPPLVIMEDDTEDGTVDDSNKDSSNNIILPIIEFHVIDNDQDDTPNSQIFDNKFMSILNILSDISKKKDISSNSTAIKRKLPIEWTEEENSYEFDILNEKIETIDDLIRLGKEYEHKYSSVQKRFNINVRVLKDLVEPLTELNNMVGMKNIKQSIFDKIIFYLQGLENKNSDFLHTVIYGSPGMGKTEVAKIIGKIYTKMGLLSKGDFKEVRLTDLKAGYLGQSELKTQKIFDEAKGCVLFMDEAYSLGAEDKMDSYSQGIIDIINPYLDKHKEDFIFIVAGYKSDLNQRFFKGNQGLRSRFGLWLDIDEYNGEDLKNIFIKKVNDYSWKLKDNSITSKFFEEHKKDFSYFGRDIENFFSKCKIAHAKRVLFCLPEDKKILTKEDIQSGYKIYKKELDMEQKDDSDFEEIKKRMYM